MKKSVVLALLVAGAVLQSPLAAQQAQPFARDPKIPVDAEYGAKIKEYTTEPFFNSPLMDYLPASKTCRRRKPCSATSPARRANCLTPKTSTGTCACSRRRARA